jgi:hypothetical protein
MGLCAINPEFIAEGLAPQNAESCLGFMRKVAADFTPLKA